MKGTYEHILNEDITIVIEFEYNRSKHIYWEDRCLDIKNVKIIAADDNYIPLLDNWTAAVDFTALCKDCLAYADKEYRRIIN